VFYDKWKDFQFSFLGANGLTEIRNAGQAKMFGVETDVNWRVSEGLTVFGSAAYTDAKLDQPYCPDILTDPTCPSPAAPNGTQLPITPKFKANLTARYEWDIGAYRAHVQGSYVYQGKSWADLRIVEREILGRLPSYSTLDVTAGVNRDNWFAELYLKNAFDERGEVSRYAECAIQVCGAQTYVVPIRPRMVGLRFGQKF
jgi:outer membrane receptor protein involved in Fe transport